MELLKEIFPTILIMKNANIMQKRSHQHSMKDIVTHFNIRVLIDRRMDDDI